MIMNIDVDNYYEGDDVDDNNGMNNGVLEDYDVIVDDGDYGYGH